MEGLDCWGLCMAYYRERGIPLVDIEYADPPESVVGWEPVDTPNDGDLVVLTYNSPRLPSHCGIYIRGGYVLHAIEGHTSRMTPWRHLKHRVTGIYRYRGCVCQSS